MVIVFELQYPDIGQDRVVTKSLDVAMDDARAALESWSGAGEELQVIITAKEMDEDEVDALPEHQGWG